MRRKLIPATAILGIAAAMITGDPASAKGSPPDQFPGGTSGGGGRFAAEGERNQFPGRRQGAGTRHNQQQRHLPTTYYRRLGIIVNNLVPDAQDPQKALEWVEILRDLANRLEALAIQFAHSDQPPSV